MASIAMIVLVTSMTMVYQVAFQEARDRLVETAQSQARLIEAVARFDKKHSGKASFEATMGQIREAHEGFEGFGDTGEFTLARLEGEQIVFLLSHRHNDLTHPQPVAFHGVGAAEPMRRALQGKSGSMVGPDYRGTTVLAAYEPVAELDLGVVAKIDLKEIRAPFITAALVTSGIAFLFVLLGLWAFRRITKPMARRVETSEKLFKDTFSLAAIGLAHVAIDGSWLRVNQALCEIVGYTREEMLKLSFQEITHPDDLEADLQHVEQILAGDIDTYAMQKRYLRKDGNIVDVNLTVSLIRDGRGNPDYFIAAIADISDLMQLKNELTDKSERLEIAINGTSDGLWLWDIETGHEWHAPQWKRLLGYHENDLIEEKYETWESRIHPNDRVRVLEHLKQHLENNRRYDCEYRLRIKSGEFRWFRDRGIALRGESGQPTRMGGSIQDITELKKAMATIKTIRGIVPLCAWCSNAIKDDQGEWVKLETYFDTHTDAQITHGMCPKCAEKFSGSLE